MPNPYRAPSGQYTSAPTAFIPTAPTRGSIAAWIDWTPLQLTTKEIEDRVISLGELIKQEEQRAMRVRSMVVGMMRGSYLIMTGMGRVMGGGMTMMFRTMYTIATQSIATIAAISAAQATQGPAGWAQSAMASIQLGFASAQLVGVLTQNDQLTQQMRGFNMLMHGLGSMISSLPSW